jgi:hypothetical protein
MIIMAKDGEVALSFQPKDGGESLIFLGAHEGHVADPMIEAPGNDQKQAQSYIASFLLQNRYLV